MPPELHAIQESIMQHSHGERIKLLAWLEYQVRHECAARECQGCDECRKKDAEPVGFGNP